MTAPWAASTDVEEFSAAAAWLLARVPVPKSVWDTLDEQAQRKAFTVAGVAQADLLRDVLLALDRAVANGTTLEDFKRDVGQQLIDAWAGSVPNPAWRLETIFRTNAQAAYNAGRHKQQSDPAIVKVRPFWQFDAILDNRTSLMCEKSDGTILPHDDPWWKTHYPPLHFGCRSIVRSLRRSQAEAKGVTKKPTDEPAQDGFGLEPGASEWKPDTKKYPQDIRKELEGRLKRTGKPRSTPKPKAEKPKAAPKAKAPKPEHTAAHWEKSFAHLGDAAKAAAWGRAAQERGLDMTAERAAELVRAHGLAKHVGAGDKFAKIEALAKSFPNTPVRDLASSLDFFGVKYADPMAAILGHLDGVKAKPGTAAMVKVIGKGPSGELEAAKAWLDAHLDSGLTTKSVLRWLKPSSRASCDVFASTPIVKAYSLRSILHEWGHAIEVSNPAILKSAKALFEARTAGEMLKSLRSLTGKSYKLNELAKRDMWFDPYCGKVYGFDATELLSMGIEYLALDPFWTYHLDREHFWWVLGCLGGSA